MYKQSYILVITLSLCLLLTRSQTADDDDVGDIFPEYTSDHRIFSGMLSIEIFERKKIHYVLAESQNNPKADPLVLWLSGGPGCSSLLSMFNENGPLLFKPGEIKPTINPNAWNLRANMLYLELPSGVGFSFNIQSDAPSDLTTTNEALSALKLFYGRFPAMKNVSLFLSGQGYAGVYAPYLAKRIIEENNDPYQIFNEKINLKGLLLGNPCTMTDECFATGTYRSSSYHYEFLSKHNFITKQAYLSYLGACALDLNPGSCYSKRQELDKMFNATNTSSYNVYDRCYKAVTGSVNSGCQDETGVKTYLNNQFTQSQWNVDSVEWTPCNSTTYIEYQAGNGSLWIYPFLIQNQLRIWIYSGDLDSTIPTSGTKKWVLTLRDSLGLAVRKSWREWWVPGFHKAEDQVGGFVWDLHELTFITVRGAGLRAALDQPASMREVLEAFMTGAPLPFKSV